MDSIPRISPIVLSTLLLLLAGAMASCELGYYWQAAGGQWEIIDKRRPIEEVLTDDAVGETVKAKLRLVLAVQDFGVDRLALPDEGRYTLYAD